jgi:hypothetical protein
MRSVQSRWPWLLVAAVLVAAGAWLLRPRDQAPASAQDASPPSAGMASDHPSTEVPPRVIQHPLEGAGSADAADAAIPSLADSDAAAWDALAGLAADASVLDVLLREHLVQRLVVMIDNLSEPRITTRALAMRSLPGTFATEPDAAASDTTASVTPGLDAPGPGITGPDSPRPDAIALRISPANAQRYAPYVEAFAQVDPQRVASTYRRFYPLFQQAYAEVAGPDAYFNDRLVAVIDHLLQAPEPELPLQVAQDAHGKFRFVDPALESRSVGQKALLRLAPAQRDRVKQQLRAIRRAIARG